MSNASPADKDKSKAVIASTPNIKLADFLQEESVTDGSTLELDSKSPKEPFFLKFGAMAARVYLGFL